MFSNPSHYRGSESEDFVFPPSRSYVEPTGDNKANSAEDVIDEIGLVLIVILGIVVAINVALNALHIA